MEKERYVKICPKCGSTDVHAEFDNHMIWAAGTPTMSFCKSCGLRNLIFPEIIESELENFRKELKEKKTND